MNTPLISVIVPVYNAEKWLRRCVESILSQTFEGFELILVDDGSTDGSSELCDTLSEEDPRITIIHQPNGGVSAARNTGIKVAQGKYLCFVDADDELPSDAFVFLWDSVKNNGNIDIICGLIDRGGILLGPTYPLLPMNTKDIEFLHSLNLWELLGAHSVGKLVKRELILRNNIFFCDGIVTGEDQLWLFFLHKYIKSYSFVNKVVYIYNWVNEESVSHTPDGILQYQSRLDIVNIISQNIDVSRWRKELPIVIEYLSVQRYKNACKINDKHLIKNAIYELNESLNSRDSNIYIKYLVKRLLIPDFLKSVGFVRFSDYMMRRLMRF